MKRPVAILAAVLAALGFDPPSTAAAAAADALPALPSGTRPGMVWTPRAVPAPADAPGLYLGNSVALSGGNALLGTPGDSVDGVPFAGAVHVYRKTGDAWIEQQTLQSSQPRESGTFGSTIAMRGPVAVIGESGSTAGANLAGGPPPQAQRHREDAARAVYVFNEHDGVWSQSARLVADDGAIGDTGALSTFGTALAVDGNTVAVGARGDAVDAERPEQGSVYVFSDDGSGWRQVQKLAADDGRAYEHFGSAVALQGDTLLIGAKDATWRRDRPQQGAVYVYTRTDGVWTQRQKLYPPEGRTASMFGQSLALDGGTALVGAYNGGATNGNGAVYVLARANGLWSVGQKLTAQNGELFDTFGGTVALSGDRAVISAHNAWIDGTVQQGADFVFEKIGGAWVRQARLVSPIGAAYKFFGYHVAIEDRTIFSSQWVDSQAYVFEGHLPATADIRPGEVRVALAGGASLQVELQIANPGDEALDFELAGSAGAQRVALKPRSAPPRLQPWPPAELARATLAQNPLAEPVYGGLGASLGTPPLSFILDDGSFENRLTIPRGPDEQSTIWLNRFAAPAGTGAFTIDSLSILFPAQDLGSVVGRQVDLVAYHDADADGDPRNAVRLGGGDHFVTVGAENQFNVFAVDFRVPGDGDVYLGFESSYARGGSWPLMYPAAIDTSAPAPGHSWLASTVDAQPPDLDDLSGPAIQGFVEDFGVRGNWLIRASGTDPANDCIAPSALPWLALSPADGSVPAGGSVAAILTLDAGGLAEGTYAAVLCAATNDPSRAVVRVPVTLDVLPDGLIFHDGFEDGP